MLSNKCRYNERQGVLGPNHQMYCESQTQNFQVETNTIVLKDEGELE